MQRALVRLFVMLCLTASAMGIATAQVPPGKGFANSVGMRFVRVEPGSFLMGESATPIPDDLTEPLTYYSRSAL